MKRVLLTLVLIIAFAAVASAQDVPKPLKLHLQGGVSMPMTPDGFKDHFKMGYQGGGGISFALNPMLELCGHVSYHRFDFDPGEGDDDMDLYMTTILYGAEVKLNLGAGGRGLYALAGAGFAKPDVSEGDLDLDTENYLTVAAGIDMGNMFLEARYVRIKQDITWDDATDTDDDESVAWVPLSIGFRF